MIAELGHFALWLALAVSVIQAVVPTVDIKAGRLVRAKDDFVFGAQVVEALQARLVAFLEEHAEISPTEFKELTGVTRKYLIPLSELFDERKVTLRVGNARKLRQARKPL